MSRTLFFALVVLVSRPVLVCAATPPIRMVAHGDVPPAALQRLETEARAACERAADWLGVELAPAPVVCHIYPTLEAKGLDTGYTLPAHSLPADGVVYAVAESGFEGELAREVASVVLWRALGVARLDVLTEGMATACAQSWYGRGAEYWAARLAAFDDAGELGWMFSNRDFHAESPLVRRALAGAFVSFLVEERGARGVLAMWSAGAPSADERARLESRWRTHLAALRRAHPAGRNRRSLTGFQRGFCFAHEGYRIRDGYLSAEADGALARLRDMGVNSVSLTPFSFLRSPGRPAPLPFSSGPGAENDESIVHAAACARRLGMTVVLKPHIWVRGGWPGEIAMAGEAEWTAFFASYTTWMRHYALLAEMHGMDVLCVGVEMSKATVGHEREWVRMVAQLRTVYSGAVTYAANWWEEYEEVSFWKDFDYVGIDCYYPLASDTSVTDARLAAAAGDVLDRIEALAARYGRQVLITEVGFASRRASWMAPHDEGNGRDDVDVRAQARCYDAFLGAVSGRTRIQGVYFWKWPSFLADGGPHHDGFTPNGKPAEAVVKRWFLGPLSR
ncbi:MAG TPA: hypothetical protein VFX92_13390 [Candidatus Krumholzibacteria bacterium]|nr:hypothetical protein [Candidatus Krumholzibacteria bacterium]